MQVNGNDAVTKLIVGLVGALAIAAILGSYGYTTQQTNTMRDRFVRRMDRIEDKLDTIIDRLPQRQ